MDVLQSIGGTVEQNLGLIKKCFQEVLAGLESKEKQLNAVQESVTESSKELDLRRESIEEWVKQVTKKEGELKEIQLVLEEGFQDSEMKHKEMGLLLEDLKVREEKLHMQEKVIEGLFEKIELERGKLESIQKSIDGKFDEISREKRHVEEKSKRSKLEIGLKGLRGLRENILASREEQLVAKEKELEARERILDLKTGKRRLHKVDNAEPGESRNQSRKRGRKYTDKEFIDPVDEVCSPLEASSVKTIVRSDPSESDTSSGNSYSRNSSSGNSSSRTTDYGYPDPEFNDFEKHRKRNCFAVNQFWAIYDEVDSMPRYYAQIMDGHTYDKLSIAWLEVDKYHGKINYHGFPAGCGKFQRANSKELTDRLIFSHQIHYEQKDWAAGSYVIYPRKAEIWALLKDWNKGSTSNSASDKQYNYEIVEVISDFIENGGIRVVHLDKIIGYVSLFQRTTQNGTFRIPAREMFRFSHRIPSYRMNGTERKGCPKRIV